MRLIVMLISCFFLINVSYADTTETIKEQKIEEQKSTLKLPELPAEKGQNKGKSIESAREVPEALNIDSKEVVKKKRANPNDGKPYYTLSGGLAPYQANLGILKYFIPEWWGHLELGVTFYTPVPVANYYTAVTQQKPYVGLKIMTGYSFYSFKMIEISLFAQFQFSFVSTTKFPLIPAIGFRFIIDFFWMDIGVGYAVTAGGSESQIFNGFQPVISLGFRF